MKVAAGYGLIPLGLSASFGPAKFNLEIRMVPRGKLEFGYLIMEMSWLGCM